MCEYIVQSVLPTSVHLHLLLRAKSVCKCIEKFAPRRDAMFGSALLRHLQRSDGFNPNTTPITVPRRTQCQDGLNLEAAPLAAPVPIQYQSFFFKQPT